MTTENRQFQMAMCRHCGHDLYVVRNGKSVGQVRCSNRSCRFSTRSYKMGKNTNEGPVGGVTWQPGQWIQDFVERIGLHRLAMWIFRQRVLFAMRRTPDVRVDLVNEETGESRRVLGREEL